MVRVTYTCFISLLVIINYCVIYHLAMCPFGLDEANQGRCSSSSLPPSPSPCLRARVGPLELANALAACVLSARLTSKHRQWAAQQLVKALAVAGRETPNRPQTYSDLAGDLRKCPLKRLEGHYNKVSFLVL